MKLTNKLSKKIPIEFPQKYCCYITINLFTLTLLNKKIK